jgi:hypothetical protein
VSIPGSVVVNRQTVDKHVGIDDTAARPVSIHISEHGRTDVTGPLTTNRNANQALLRLERRAS